MGARLHPTGKCRISTIWKPLICHFLTQRVSRRATSQVWCSRLHCESISCVKLSYYGNCSFQQKKQGWKWGEWVYVMSTYRSVFPLFLWQRAQQASSQTQASRIFIPSPSFLSHQPESSLLLLDVPTGTDDICSKMEKDGEKLGTGAMLGIGWGRDGRNFILLSGKKRDQNHVSLLES